MTEVKNPERIVTNCPVPLSGLELCSIIQPLVLWLAASVEHYFMKSMKSSTRELF